MKNNKKNHDIRLVMPIFLAKKLPNHPLTKSLYPLSLGKVTDLNQLGIQSKNNKNYSLLYCLSGGGFLTFNNKTRTVNQGDLVIIAPYINFYFQPITQQKTNNKLTIKHQQKNCLYWINFNGNLADDFAERLLMKMENNIANVGFLSDVVKDFDHLLELGRRGYTATNVIHAVHILQQTLSYLALQIRINAFNENNHFNLTAIETLMENNIHQDLSLDTLAHYSQLSKFHFAKKFKELTDSSPIQHFINMKMQHACDQLNNSDKAIKEIASNVGYTDPYYFSRLFKKVIGMSPKQYRDSRHSV